MVQDGKVLLAVALACVAALAGCASTPKEAPSSAAPAQAQALVDADVAALHAVAKAAVAWWTQRRPRGWSLEQHLADPLVNCEGSHERQPAEAVSKWVSLKG